MEVGTLDIPLPTLPSPPPQRSTNQTPPSSTTAIQVQQRPSIPTIPPAPSSLHSASVPSLALHSTTAIAASPQAPPSTPVPPSGRYQRWCHATTKQCSSTRIGAVVALIALGVGGYYYYGQYMISWKSWEVGIWKDCHDRVDIVNSSVCDRYANVSYDQIASRAVEPNKTTKASVLRSTVSLVTTAVIISMDCLLQPGWLAALGGLIVHVLAFISDMTFGHNFPHPAYLAVFVFVNTSVAASLAPSGSVRLICAATSLGLAVLCGVRQYQWKRNSLWGLPCDPLFRALFNLLILFFPIFTLFRFSHVGMLMVLPDHLRNTMDFIFMIICMLLGNFFGILSIAQRAILKRGNNVHFDQEAQVDCVIGVSRKAVFIERLLDYVALSSQEKKDQ